jgi:hypothetical protein
MNEVYQQDDRYPEWMKAWNARTAEIDQQLIDYCRDTLVQTEDAAEEIYRKLVAWWDRQHLEPQARAEYEQAKADQQRLRAQVEHRLAHLNEDGRIAWAQRTRVAGDNKSQM